MEQVKLKTGDGVELYVTRDEVMKPKAALLIVHGLCEHSGRYAQVAEEVTGWGMSVWRYDHRGHGRSGGERGYVDDFHQYLDDAELVVQRMRMAHPGRPLFMLGHSMGGYVAAAYGVKYPGRMIAQVFSGAATIVLPIFAEYENLDWASEPRKPVDNALADLISHDPEVVRAYKEDPLVLKQFTQNLVGEVFVKGARWLVERVEHFTCPCLILHGAADQIVTPDASRFFYRKCGAADRELKLYERLYHEILNEPERAQVMADIRQWMETRI